MFPEAPAAPQPRAVDAVVIGAGPNGLAAAITLARQGLRVVVREANAAAGGAARSMELTLPGFVHDFGATVIALGRTSPFLSSLPLAELGVRFADPPASVGHPLDDGPAALLAGSVERTADDLKDDGYRRLLADAVEDWPTLAPILLSPPRPSRHAFKLGQFGLKAIRSARSLSNGYLKSGAGAALFAGIAAHSVIPLEQRGSGAFGLVLAAAAHADGWPVVVGGTQRLTDALVDYLRELGGAVELSSPAESLEAIRLEYPNASSVLCDLTPSGLIRFAGDALPEGYRRRLAAYRHGPGAFKLDWALDGPVPWRDERLARAGTIHLGGTFDEIADAERAAWEGRHHDRPYVLAVQPTMFDPTRAPPGKHTFWAYCHVPNASTVDMTKAIEGQIERFAPGFRDRILARGTLAPADLERHNANLVGGDVNGGAQDLRQTFARPVCAVHPHSTPVRGLFLCSSSTPPGSGVHGMCGLHAALLALRRVYRISPGR